MRYGIYIDFDNLIGGFKANLHVKREEELIPFQRRFIPVLLKKFLQALGLPNSNQPPRFKKVFAEYHNLPFKNLLRPQPFVFLNNIGITPINPFVIGSGGKNKNKNASDISLTLEVVNDVILKNIPIDAIVLFSGDIDFYPLISWIREHTEKNVYLISFSDRLKKNYIDIFRHLIGWEYIIPAERFLISSIKASLNPVVLKSELGTEVFNSLLEDMDQGKDWLQEVITKLGEKKTIMSDQPIRERFSLDLEDLYRSLNMLINTYKESRNIRGSS